MNEPLRHEGYTLYQSSWGKTKTGAVYSDFSVVRNPSDRIPRYACYVIGAGLLVHFGMKIGRHIQNQRRST